MLTHLTTGTPLNLSEHPPHHTRKAACHSAARAPPPGRLGRRRKGRASFRLAPRQAAVQVGARSGAVLSSAGERPRGVSPQGAARRQPDAGKPAAICARPQRRCSLPAAAAAAAPRGSDGGASGAPGATGAASHTPKFPILDASPLRAARR